MNVAIILSGHLRCWEKVFPNFKEHFIDRYNPDIFIHTWDNEGYWVPTEGPMGIYELSPPIDAEAVQRAYKPVASVFESFLDYEPTFAERAKNFPIYYHRPRNIISMFYKMGAGINLMEQHVMKTGKQYDLVIRMRPDMLMHQPLPEFTQNTFWTLAHNNHLGQPTGDQFQIGSVENVMSFSKIGMNLENIYSHTGVLCPHICSFSWIKMLGLPWQEFHVHKELQHTPNGEYKPAI